MKTTKKIIAALLAVMMIAMMVPFMRVCAACVVVRRVRVCGAVPTNKLLALRRC